MSSTPAISPVLFLDSKGEKMRFYIRPGPAKVQLRDMINGGGGCLTRLREPGAILLADPKEMTGITSNSGELYVSTEYIWDCVKKNQQLDEMSYRLSIPQNKQTRSLRSKEGVVGRMGYTTDEDEAILDYISKRLKEARGNSVWQLMEKHKITSHSWQSMKDRYLKHLMNRPTKSKIGQLTFVSMPKPHKDTAQQGLLDNDIPVKLPVNEPATPSEDDSAVVQEVAGDDPPEERPECPAEEAVDGDGVAALATTQQTSGENPEGDIVAVLDNEHGEPSPKRSRPDADERSGNQGMSGPGNEMTPNKGGLQSSKTSTPTKRGLGILDRAVMEFRNSLWVRGSPEVRSNSQTWNEDNSQPQMTASNLSQSDSDTEIFHEAMEQVTDSPPQQKKSMDSECNGGMTAEDGESTKMCNVKQSSCRSHLFLLEAESQEDDFSQTPQEEGCATHPVNLEGGRLVLDLMKDCSKNLLDVAKALLKTSGDITLAQRHLLQGTFPRPLWRQREDQILLSADPVSKRQLEEKYGKDGVSTRASFLKTE